MLAHDVAPDGSVANRRVFAECDAPDGLAVDSGGGVWVASYGGGCVVRFGATERAERPVAVPAQLVSSCCFGGDDLRDLVVTSQDNTEAPERGGSIFRLRTDLPGLPPPLAQV